jgi:membrane-bound lytic murein transglycosylase B
MPYRGGRAAQAFADEVAARRDWDPAWVMVQLAGARQLPRVAQLIMPPPPGHGQELGRLPRPLRRAAAHHRRLAFWQQNTRRLQRAEQAYGVPPEVVVGIVGVETFYGRMTGDFRVLDALATLSLRLSPPAAATAAPSSAASWKSCWCWRAAKGCAPTASRARTPAPSAGRSSCPAASTALRSTSTATATSTCSAAWPTPSAAWRTTCSSMAGSAACPRTSRCSRPDDPGRATLLAPDIKPSFTPVQFAEQGAQLDEAGRRHDGPLALVELQNGDAAPSFVAGTQNFYAITRYNWSSYYAHGGHHAG